MLESSLVSTADVDFLKRNALDGPQADQVHLETEPGLYSLTSQAVSGFMRRYAIHPTDLWLGQKEWDALKAMSKEVATKDVDVKGEDKVEFMGLVVRRVAVTSMVRVGLSADPDPQ